MLQTPAADSGAIAESDRGNVGGNRSQRGDMDHLARAAKRHAFANSSKAGAFATACDPIVSANPRTAGRSAVGRSGEARLAGKTAEIGDSDLIFIGERGGKLQNWDRWLKLLSSQDRRIGLVRAHSASHGGDIGGGPWGRTSRDFHFARAQERRGPTDGGIQQKSLPPRTCRGVAAARRSC